MKTRDRIILTAREVFNRDGYTAVTTATLAEACGIAEGNLWYHFKTKRDLLSAIADDFSALIEQRMAMRPDGDDPAASYAEWLAALMREQRLYRFLYRDSPHHDEHVPLLAEKVPQWLRGSERSIALQLAAMVERGLLDWPADRLSDLAASATIILRNGLEYYTELGEPEGAVRRTLLQHLTLFEHRLDSAALHTIRAAIDRIDEEMREAA